MRTPTQMLVGMAVAGLVAGQQRPLALVAGAGAGVLPDLLDWWLRLVRCAPDITVTPDPLTQDLTPVAEGLRAAVRDARGDSRPCVVRLNPCPDSPYALDFDRQHALLVTPPGTRGKRAKVMAAPDEVDRTRLALRHPLPLTVRTFPVDLELAAADARLACRDLGAVAGGGHACAVGIVLAGATGAAMGPWLGVATGAAWAAHLLLDAAGDGDWHPWWPFSARRMTGLRTWNAADPRGDAMAVAVALAALLALLLAARG